MKTRAHFLLVIFIFNSSFTYAIPSEGFYLPDSVSEITFRYKSIENLIVLPVRINDTQTVNLILDTGCTNLVLFGKRFSSMVDAQSAKNITFSGLGNGKPVNGYVSLGNKVSFDAIIGKRIAIVVVPEKNIFQDIPGIDGVIGYELFLKFEIEINFNHQKITFRPAMVSPPDKSFTMIPLRIENSRPIISCTIVFSEESKESCDLLIDTGSCLGLLFTTSNNAFRKTGIKKATIGRGFNGFIKGENSVAEKLIMDDFHLKDIETAIVFSEDHHYASLGISVLKDYTLLLNYCKEYAGLRKI
jgi:hypothetical protein